MTLNCAIVDDEPLALDLLESYVNKTPFLALAGKYSSAVQAMKELPGNPVDLLFLDIQMPELNGLEFSKMVDSHTRIIFTTAFNQYAIDSYRVNALDYLLKPIKKTDFGDMLHRMYERLEAKIGQAAYYQVLDGYARGLVGEEEVKHAVSSVQPANVAQRPGVLAKEGEQSPTKIVRDALYYIRRHYNENISLTDVAEHINVNKSYLCDVFKKEQKVTILQYMTNLRIEKAKELLLHTDMKMYEISVEVGYNDYTYFSQIFKRNTGETLSEFRKKAGSKK